MEIIKTEGRYSHVRKFINPKDKSTFTIPVIDVRDGTKARQRVDAIIKAVNVQKGSRFMKPSYSAKGFTYNSSMKGVER